MKEQPEALRLAKMLEQDPRSKSHHAEAAAKLRQLHEANEAFGKRQEWWNERMFVLEEQRDALLEALKLALSSHGVMLTSYPPQDAWKFYGVEEKARAAIKMVEEGK